MSGLFSSANTLGITTAVFLCVSKPSEQSFSHFFRDWVTTHLVEGDDALVGGTLSQFISRGISWATVETVMTTAEIQIVNAGVCYVATSTIPDPQRGGEWVELVFVGVAGDWHFLPKEALESGKMAAGYAGISLAVLSIAQTIYRAGSAVAGRTLSR